MLSEIDAQNQLKIMTACNKRLSQMEVKDKVTVGLDNTFYLKGDFTANELRQIAEVLDLYIEMKKSFKLPEILSDKID